MGKKIFVYGTLREGFGNGMHCLSNSRFLGQETLNVPFRMVSCGGFPALVGSDEVHAIVGEVFETTDSDYASVERLEGYPGWYDKVDFNTDQGEAEAYFMPKEQGYEGNPKVESGDWKEFVESKKSRKAVAYE